MVLKNVIHDESLEYPFRFFAEVPTLQKMASHRFCQAIYHACISSESDLIWPVFNDNRDKDSKLQKKLDELLEGLKLPRSIENMLKGDAKKIHDESSTWVNNLHKDLSNRYARFESKKLDIDFDWCTWLPNGELDFRSSTTKMLNSSKLSERQKFIAASIYCINVQILKTISSNTIRYFAKNVTFDKEPLLFYWVCYSQNKLQRVRINEGSTLESTMAEVCDSYELTDLEYFWPRLSNDRRISLADKLLQEIDSSYRFTALERLFFTISSDSRLPSLCANYLASSLVNSLSSHQLNVWHRYKNQITGLDFGDIFIGTFTNVMHIEDRMQMLVHIWDTARDHQREHVVQYEASDIIDDFADFDDSKELLCSSAYHFIGLILSQTPKDERLKLLEKFMDSFIEKIKLLEPFKEMVHLCLPNDNDQSQFKYSLSRSNKLQEMCVEFLERGEYAEFDRALDWVFSDRSPNSMVEYKKMIFTLMTWSWDYESTVKTFIASIHKWNDLSEFIDKTYVGDEQSAFNVKLMLIELAAPVTRYDQNFRKNFDVIRQIVEKEFPLSDLTEFKRTRLKCLVKKFRSRAYWENEQEGDEIRLQNFVEWCCDGDEESISKFKNCVPDSLLLEVIVDKVMRCPFNTQTSELETLLRRSDWYLKWFVGSDQKVIECKLQAIEYSNCNVKEFYGWTMDEKNLPNRQILLRWLCGDDQAAIEKCKEWRFGSRRGSMFM